MLQVNGLSDMSVAIEGRPRNGSAESAAAVEAAMSWLQRAEAVRILWAEEYQRRGPRAPDLQTHLAMHGVAADLMMFKPIDTWSELVC